MDEPGNVSPTPATPLGSAQTMPPVRKPRIRLPIILFLLTICTTFFNGACEFLPSQVLWESFSETQRSYGPIRQALLLYWQNGLIYSAALLLILFAHEMGHYLVTVFYRIPSSLPYFLPMPLFLGPFLPGTLGAVIAMDGRRADRVQIFDIGIAGPIAGLILAVPVMWMGVCQLEHNDAIRTSIQIEAPIVVRWMIEWAGKDQTLYLCDLRHNPLFLAGYIGLLITGLNMMPVSQLDGGHVIHCLFGRKGRYVARGFIIAAITYMVVQQQFQWFLMLIIVLFLGPDHPPTRNDNMNIGMFRRALGFASLVIPVLCFPLQLLIIPEAWLS